MSSIRGFKVVKGYEEKNINLPKRATKFSAGYDIEAGESCIIKPREIVRVKTGIKVYMAEDEVFKIYPRSSLPVKKGLIMPNMVGIIDSDYYENNSNDGEISLQLYNITDHDVVITQGEKLCQGIFVKYFKADDEVDSIRTGGFGSTTI